MTAVGYVPEPLKRIKMQPRVRDFLASAYQGGYLSHAYLFTGTPGSGKHEAAEALAQCVICPNDADGSCDECIRVAHHTHPDVRFLEPESVHGYLVGQIRTLIEDVSMTPVRAKSKVYIIGSAERLWGTSANALLKTIEEPPPNVMFILLARSADSVLPTIVSRCQQVPFRVVSPNQALRQVSLSAGCDDDEALIALSICRTPERAVDFLASSARREIRRQVVRTVLELPSDDEWDVLKSARQIVEAVSEPFEAARKSKNVVSEEEAEYLSPRALKILEEANKRELTARERRAMEEAIACAESLLRDVLALVERTGESVVNADSADTIRMLAEKTTTEGVLKALGACKQAVSDLARNVTPQLALEVMLLTIKEAL